MSPFTKIAIKVIPNILAIFDPKILPIAKLFCFFTIEITVATTSGKEVPNATTVIPIAVSATPNTSVRFLA
mgnify:FL=1